MAARRITVGDLDAMTPGECQEAFEASIAWDPTDLPTDRLTALEGGCLRRGARRRS